MLIRLPGDRLINTDAIKLVRYRPEAEYAAQCTIQWRNQIDDPLTLAGKDADIAWASLRAKPGLQDLADTFEALAQPYTSQDSPEGTACVQISATLAQHIAQTIRRVI